MSHRTADLQGRILQGLQQGSAPPQLGSPSPAHPAAPRLLPRLCLGLAGGPGWLQGLATAPQATLVEDCSVTSPQLCSRVLIPT